MKKIIFLLFFPLFIHAYTDNIDEIIPDDQIVKTNEEFARGDIAKVAAVDKTIIWTRPLIIDNNNHDFDGLTSFTFPSNIIFQPDPNYNYPFMYNNLTSAIIVNKDNFTIDLQGYNLSFNPPATSNFLINNPTYGIAVYQGVKNLRIISSTKHHNSHDTQKGSITNFTGFAIYASGSRQNYNNYDVYSLMIKNLIIDNLLITQNKNGIFIENALNPSITNTHIIYNYAPQNLYGIYCSYILNGSINSCKVNQNWSYKDVIGIHLEDTSNILIEKNEANSNRSLKNGDAKGFNLVASPGSSASSDNVLKECTANRNLCSNTVGKFSIGFGITNLSRHNSIIGCISLNGGHTENGLPSPITPPASMGFAIQDSNFNIISQNIAGYHTGPFSYGFFDNATLSTCYYTSNSSMYNNENYQVNVPDATFGTPVPLAVIILASNNTGGALGSGPIYANYSIQATL